MSNKIEQDLRPQHIVALGASAGGLEALEEYFKHCPVDLDVAYVVIQHLSPDYKSMMADLLARHTKLPIVTVQQGMALTAGKVFLIPPGVTMRLNGDRFELRDKQPHILSLPIDIFFTSMAKFFHKNAIAIVLSGTGSDGARGALAVYEEGGFVIAQTPSTAKFDGMPRSVIATGVVDEVIDVAEMPPRVTDYLLNPQEVKLEKELLKKTAASQQDSPLPIDRLFQLLKRQSNIDFEAYKMATVSRRIERRMQVKQYPTLSSYIDFLEKDSTEQVSLFRELLIPVTRFFRDTEAFEFLKCNVIRPLVEKAQPNQMLRVWCAGCSSGEEVYSLAILFLEVFEELEKYCQIKFFATDVNPQMVERASAGVFSDSIAAEVDEVRLKTYFTQIDQGYRINADVRQMIVFARHNLLVDPPFTRMDLVSCRNTLIYFKADAQKKALDRLQYAVKHDGHLFLGSSESLGYSSKSFEVIHTKFKLFQRVSKAALYLLDAPPIPKFEARQPMAMEPRVTRPIALEPRVATNSAEQYILEEAFQLILDEYVPPALLINEQMDVLHLYGNVQPYIRIRQGMASMNLSRLLPEEVVPVASALIFKAIKDNTDLHSDFIGFKAVTGEQSLVRMIVRPFTERVTERCALLVFEAPSQDSYASQVEQFNLDEVTQNRIELLQKELTASRENLQATIEELETANEELQATNEELMAANEELQSSNEELQSVNEELNTVNAEFQEKMVRLNQVNADLDSMAKAVGVATVFVDYDLNVTRFTPDALSLFKFRESDIGRPLTDIHHQLVDIDIEAIFRLTLNSAERWEQEVRSVDGRVFLMRILPYSIPSLPNRGALATFVDVTVIHDKNRLQEIINALPEELVVLRLDGTIALTNMAWEKLAKRMGFDDGLINQEYMQARLALYPDDSDDFYQRVLSEVKKVLDGRQPFIAIPIKKVIADKHIEHYLLHIAQVSGSEEYALIITQSYLGKNLEQYIDEH
ncbi:chemotaxis protein CheR [Thiomicrospira aerophila AL3]|uniref:protein-glutamate O-methyltransferase n=1 Tax=Thiomicrospira aerophila AL3 TaxID=717772 RepID=W0DXA9_9GAMM|nr:CheR family methyltransferase [Thiomicrospira aerophila]AHF01609.1 chemotaxis protein CheR [Thiomicrospira aerophila AL3]